MSGLESYVTEDRLSPAAGEPSPASTAPVSSSIHETGVTSPTLGDDDPLNPLRSAVLAPPLDHGTDVIGSPLEPDDKNLLDHLGSKVPILPSGHDIGVTGSTPEEQAEDLSDPLGSKAPIQSSDHDTSVTGSTLKQDEDLFDSHSGTNMIGTTEGSGSQRDSLSPDSDFENISEDLAIPSAAADEHGDTTGEGAHDDIITSREVRQQDFEELHEECEEKDFLEEEEPRLHSEGPGSGDHIGITSSARPLLTDSTVQLVGHRRESEDDDDSEEEQSDEDISAKLANDPASRSPAEEVEQLDEMVAEERSHPVDDDDHGIDYPKEPVFVSPVEGDVPSPKIANAKVEQLDEMVAEESDHSVEEEDPNELVYASPEEGDVPSSKIAEEKLLKEKEDLHVDQALDQPRKETPEMVETGISCLPTAASADIDTLSGPASQIQDSRVLSHEMPKPHQIIPQWGWCDLRKLPPRVVELVYWRDVKKSGAVFGSGLVVLLSLIYYSLISVVAYITLATLSVTLSFKLYKGVIQTVQKTNDGHPFKRYLEVDTDLPEDKVHDVTDKLMVRVNHCLAELKRLIFVQDVFDSIKFGALAWCLTYVGAWFNTMTLVILAYIALFTLPKVYESNQSQIDQNLDLVKTRICELVSKVKAVIPLGKKEKEP